MLPRKIPALVTYSQNIVKCMTGNAYFTSPTPPLATAAEAIVTLSNAESAVLTRLKGAVRDTARSALVVILHGLQRTVQATADADPENAAVIILSAGMAVHKTPVRPDVVFHAKPGPTTGSAALVVPSVGKRASYEWEYSLDGGRTWSPATPTLQAKTVITSLPVGATVQFRHRGVTKDGVADWSAPVMLLVK